MERTFNMKSTPSKILSVQYSIDNYRHDITADLWILVILHNWNFISIE